MKIKELKKILEEFDDDALVLGQKAFVDGQTTFFRFLNYRKSRKRGNLVLMNNEPMD